MRSCLWGNASMRGSAFQRILLMVAVVAALVSVGAAVMRRPAVTGVDAVPAAVPASAAAIPAAVVRDVIDVGAPLPPFPTAAEAGPEGARAIRALAEAGKARLAAGDEAGALAAWGRLTAVAGAGDEARLYYVRLLRAQGYDREVASYFSARFPDAPAEEFYREAAAFYLAHRRYREAHHCFEAIARTSGDPDAERMASYCYQAATTPDGAAPDR